MLTRLLATVTSCVLVLAVGAVSQDHTIACKEFRMLLKTGKRVTGTEATITSTEFAGKAFDGTEIRYPLGDVRSVDREIGTQAGKGALIGAGIGALSIVYAIIQISADENTVVDNSKVFPVTAVCVGGGALIGLAIGSGSSRWDRVQLPQITGSVLPDGRLRFGLALRF